MDRWTRVFELDALPVGGVRVAKGPRGPVAVFRLDQTTARAVDDRCPHQGYPLAQGTVAGEVVTCCYHNFKFDLRSGACLLGEEAVDTFPVELRDGAVWLDLREKDRAADRQRRWSSLDRALVDNSLGQIARDVVRLLGLGVTPAQLATFTAAWDARRGRYGSTHALPVAAAGLALAGDGLEAAHALVPALEFAAADAGRHPEHPPAAPLPVDDPVEALAQAITAEALDRALGIAAGAEPDEVVRGVLLATTENLMDYGHTVIFAMATRDLLPHASPAEARDLCAGLVRSAVLSTRDDSVPAWSHYRADAAALPSPPDGTGGDADALARQLVAATSREAVRLVHDAFAGGDRAVLDGLALLAAERMLRFDLALDRDPEVHDTWLDLTHGQTFVHAARGAWALVPRERAARWAYQAARLLTGLRPLDSAAPDHTPEPGDLAEAIRSRDPERAARVALATPPEVAADVLRAVCLDDLAVQPLFVAHKIKQALAAGPEAVVTGDRRPAAAAARFLADRIGERRTRARVGEAIRLLRDGRPPKTLAH